ncbi:WD40 repeat domain-containing protein [Nonomuraea insulae]|uniref:WD40 repeat domain-containing protein n=1 Tax=Nonomuraea insulae TaxID=1616787 RepID=A0ABW1CLY2_9ACTN
MSSRTDARTGRQLGQSLTGHKDEVFSVVYSPDGARLAGGGWDGTVRQWEVALPADRLAAVCIIAERGFTAREWQQYIPTCRTEPHASPPGTDRGAMVAVSRTPPYRLKAPGAVTAGERRLAPGRSS